MIGVVSFKSDICFKEPMRRVKVVQLSVLNGVLDKSF